MVLFNTIMGKWCNSITHGSSKSIFGVGAPACLQKINKFMTKEEAKQFHIGDEVKIIYNDKYLYGKTVKVLKIVHYNFDKYSIITTNPCTKGTCAFSNVTSLEIISDLTPISIF